ncbi:MAG: hypothetical protein H7833_14375 [Magnetococcus sp. DMHC-1]|nr:hypothetical protein [Magnetococcales bacterium]
MGIAYNDDDVYLGIDGSFICDKIYEADIIYEGAYKTVGYLREITSSTCLFEIDNMFPVGTKCFVKINFNSVVIYSRGKVFKNIASGSHIKLENFVSIFNEITQEIKLSNKSTLEKLVISKKINHVMRKSGCINVNNKKNCWEYNACGKEDRCPAGISCEHDGVFGGKNGGRFCAFIDGTLSKDDLNIEFDDKFTNHCSRCCFFEEIKKDIGDIDV